MTLSFNDGMTFNTEGPLRPTYRNDGWYVVGQGMLVAVATQQEACDLIEELNDRSAREEVEKSLCEAGIIEDPDLDGGLLG